MSDGMLSWWWFIIVVVFVVLGFLGIWLGNYKDAKIRHYKKLKRIREKKLEKAVSRVK